MDVIDMNSEAGEFLRLALSHLDVYKVSFDFRANGVAIKVNERMWTSTLSTDS